MVTELKEFAKQRDSTGKYTHDHNAIVKKEEKETNVSDKKCYQQSARRRRGKCHLWKKAVNES